MEECSYSVMAAPAPFHSEPKDVWGLEAAMAPLR